MLTSEQVSKNHEKFKSLILEAAQLKPEKQKGLEKLLDYLEQTDFYKAPASTKYHQNYEGGLVEHSLNVLEHLELLCKAYNVSEEKVSRYSMIITALLHDLCKINLYEKAYQGHYLKDKDGKDIIIDGRKKWVEDEVFRYRNDFLPMGHAMKSLFVISHFIILTEQEASAIAGHMGEFDKSDYFTSQNLSDLYIKNTLAYLLHEADVNDLYMSEYIHKGE